MGNWLAKTFDQALDKTVLLSFNRIGYALRQGMWDDSDLEVDMTGQVCLVTGANSGLGFITARELARRNATVYMIARNRQRGAEAQAEIIAKTNNEQVHLELADLSSLAQVRDLAERFTAQEARLDVLIHNAGVLLSERQESEDGLEMTLATNVIGPFLLTHLLTPILKRSAPARIIVVSSGGMYTRKLNVADLQFEEEAYDGPAVYAQTKRIQVILTELAAERLAGSGVTINAMHPGWVDTPGLQSSLPTFSKLMGPTLRTPEQGADTIIWLAVAPHLDSESGQFWLDRRPRETHKMERTKSTAQERQKLWAECVRLSGLAETE